MKKNNKTILKIMLVLFVFIQISSEFFTQGVFANSDNIVQSLEIVNPKEQYFPGDTVNMKGTWKLDDDNEQKEYKEGDTFSISIPEGMTPNFNEIDLGGKGNGKIVDGKIVFTFNRNIEQLMNREGGFFLSFKVNEPEDKGLIDLPLDMKDENNNTLIKETIVINNEEREVGVESSENFAKGAYNYDPVNFSDGLKWYVRVNQSGELKGNTAILEDRVESNQIIDFDSIVVSQQMKGENSTGTPIDVPIVKDADNRGFSIKLDIVGKWYTVTYNTIYIGDYTGEDFIKLKNTATLTTDNNERVPMDGNSEGNPVLGDFGVGGWAKGDGVIGKFELLKVDSVTKKPLEGVSFKLVNKFDNNISYNLVTDAEGKASVDNIVNGIYTLEELEAPEGYIKAKPVDIRINNKVNATYHYTLENDPSPFDIVVNKKWTDHEKNEITAENDVVIKLLANGKPIRQVVLKTSQNQITFKNLTKYDNNGEIINYTVEEILPNGYTNELTYNEDEDTYLIINIKDAPIEPELPEPELPEPEVPVEPELPEPEVPVEPELPEPEVPVAPELPEPEVPEEPELPEPEVPELPEVEEVLSVNKEPEKEVNYEASVLPSTGKSSMMPYYFVLTMIGVLIKKKQH